MQTINGVRAGDLVRVPSIQGTARVERVENGVVTARTQYGQRVHVSAHAVQTTIDFYA